MTEVISVRFKNKGKVYFFDPNGVIAATGESVIVETSKGLELAECVRGNHNVEDSAVMPPLRPVIRVATPEDLRRAEENKKKEKTAALICRERIEKHGLDMKLVDVEYSFDGNKILFFFTSDGRVDFRELVKDLASQFHTRIELRQIGVRDEARMLGGLGICGRPFCCAGFLDDFEPVSIKMAKTQGLSLNPTKISGTCGRLMCCLKYEQDAYEDLVKNVPKIESFVQTPGGKGTVIDVNLLRGRVKVRMDDQYDNPVKVYEAGEVEVLGGKAKRAEFLAAVESGEVQLQRSQPRLKTESRLHPAPQTAAPAAPETVPATPAEAREETPRQERRPMPSRSRPERARQERPRRQENPARQEMQAQTPNPRPARPAKPARPQTELQSRTERPQEQPGGPQRYRSTRRQTQENPPVPAENAVPAAAPGSDSHHASPSNGPSRYHRYHNNHRSGGKPRNGGDGSGPKSE